MRRIIRPVCCEIVSAQRLLNSSSRCGVLYLPPYSPDFNPIEQAWSKLKQLLRAVKARALDQLEPAIARAIGPGAALVNDTGEELILPDLTGAEALQISLTRRR